MTARALFWAWAAVKTTAAAVVCVALCVMMLIAATKPEPRYIDGVSPAAAWLAVLLNN
jgi:hypothetical protein